MEQGRDFDAEPAVVRHRRRQQTPDAPPVPERRSVSRNNSLSPIRAADVQSVSMQIRPPGSISAHESKILRRRDKTFVGVAARSHSQPRQAEKLTSPEAHQLLRTTKRSLSSPRHKDESSEAEVPEREYAPPDRRTDDDKLTRLEQNLRRFESERQRFEQEKRKFEREKREHKQRHKQMMDAEERKKMLENYRKLSDRINLPSDVEERRRLVKSLKQSHHGARPKAIYLKPRVGDESSALESSDSEAVHAEMVRARRERAKPPSRHNSLSPPNGNDTLQVPDQSTMPRRRRSSKETSGGSSASEAHLEKRRGSSPRAVPEETRRGSSPKPAPDLIRRRSSSRAAPENEPAPQTSLEESREVRRRSRPIPEETKRKSASFTAQDKTDQLDFLKVMRRKSYAKVDEARRRSVTPNKPVEVEKEENEPVEVTEEAKPPKKPSFIAKIISFFRRQPKPTPEATPEPKPGLLQALRECREEWTRLKQDYPSEVEQLRLQRNKCVVNVVMLVLLCGFGGLLFRYAEGSIDSLYKCEVKKVKRDFIDTLWVQSHMQREDDWKSTARTKLRKFEEEVVSFHELGGRTLPGAKAWNFVNSVLYCWMVITTIGYGHIVPQTVLGRSLTIVYAIFGIPIFLILLADFGKFFTRGIKFIWAYVRRLYYTGTCRKVRKHQHMRDMMTGLETMYDMAVRRPSMYFGPTEDVESNNAHHLGAPGTPQSLGTHLSVSNTETPTSPYPETYEIDDEFNLPISLALLILILYILVGAMAFVMSEEWSPFDAFYFVFISMSTIGFGDFVPSSPTMMMCCTLYLIFGLSLTSMFINVVQIKLTNTFKDASAKIGATIGLTMAEEAQSQSQIRTPTSDVPSVHLPAKPGEAASQNGDQPPPLPVRFVRVPAEGATQGKK